MIALEEISEFGQLIINEMKMAFSGPNIIYQHRMLTTENISRPKQAGHTTEDIVQRASSNESDL